MNKYSVWMKEIKEPWRIQAHYYVIDGEWVTFKKIVQLPTKGTAVDRTDHQPVFSAPADNILVINRYDEVPQ